MCGIGATRVVLHIRSGPVGGGSAESCGNASVLNAVEILPCAERAPLHMGARPLKTNIPGKTPESRGKPGIGSWGRSSPMCNTPARTEKNPTRPRGSPPGARPVQAPREVVTPPPHPSRPPHRRSRREKLNAPTGARCSLTVNLTPHPITVLESQCTCRCVVLPDSSSRCRPWSTPFRLNAPTGAWCSLT